MALFNVLHHLKERGCTVILVSHQTNLLRTADHIAFMHDGAVKMFGTRDEVLGTLGGQPKPTVVPTPKQDKTTVKMPARLKAAE